MGRFSVSELADEERRVAPVALTFFQPPIGCPRSLAFGDRGGTN